MPAFAKAQITREIVRLMPGVFVSMDHKENLGHTYIHTCIHTHIKYIFHITYIHTQHIIYNTNTYIQHTCIKVYNIHTYIHTHDTLQIIQTLPYIHTYIHTQVYLLIHPTRTIYLLSNHMQPTYQSIQP